MKIHTKKEDIKFKNGVSAPLIMESNAGCYVGTVDNSDGFLQPYTRLSDYMSQTDAESFLQKNNMFTCVITGITYTKNFD